MSSTAVSTVLPDRALIRVEGPDWSSFLQGLLTQDVEGMAPGEARYAALLNPQGRLLYDLFVHADATGAMLDVAAAGREALLARLKLYRLRAKVELAAVGGQVRARFGDDAVGGPGWTADPRLPALGWRSVQAPASAAAPVSPEAYDAHRLALGIGDLDRDALADRAYALEANLDLLHGVDFKKGCFVGQETTSRMKRRGGVRSRLVPLAFDGPAPPPGAEVMAGMLRAGEVRSGADGRALALLRLDRAAGATLSVDGCPARLDAPPWLAASIVEAPSQSSQPQADARNA